jgi:hypothetical protein
LISSPKLFFSTLFLKLFFASAAGNISRSSSMRNNFGPSPMEASSSLAASSLGIGSMNRTDSTRTLIARPLKDERGSGGFKGGKRLNSSELDQHDLDDILQGVGAAKPST